MQVSRLDYFIRRWFNINFTDLDGTPLAGLERPVGVRGLELDPFIGAPSFFPDMLLCRLEVGVLPVVLMVLRGIRLGVVESSVISSNINFILA